MTSRKSLAGGAVFHGSGEISGAAQTVAVALAEAATLDWAVIDQGGTLELRLTAGVSLPAALGAEGRVWELAASLTGPMEVTLAVASGPALDAAGVVAPTGGDALAVATALARMPLPALDDGPEVVWDRLAHAARRAQSLLRERRMLAAALTFRGRGRLIGPIAGDLLIRFGVSAWR